MKVLITGGGGQLARALESELLGHELSCVPHSELDITRLAACRSVLAERGPELVVNCAAYTAVDRAETEPDEAYRVNALGPRNLALVTREMGIPLLHVSTDYVFDGVGTRPYHEFCQPKPRSVYGASKLAGEQEVRAINPHHYLVRTAWLYHLSGRNFPLIMRELAQRQPTVRVVSDQYGSPTFAPHLARAMGELICGENYGVYHMAGQGETSWFELTRRLFAGLGLDVEVIPVSTGEYPRAAERPRYSALTSIQDPCLRLPPWEEGLSEYVEHVRALDEPGRRRDA